MKLLEERILKDGHVKGGNILKVDSFLNHQIDVNLYEEIGKDEKLKIFENWYQNLLKQLDLEDRTYIEASHIRQWFIENIESCKLSKKLSFKEKENKKFSNNIKRMNLSIWEKSFLN